MAFDQPEIQSRPLQAAPWSDATAWVLMEMARLAYKRFERASDELDAYLDQLVGLADQKTARRLAEAYKRALAENGGTEGRAELEVELGEGGFALVDTFNKEGSQAYIAKREADQVVVLAFRGTELRDLHDIKADLNIRFFHNRDGSKTHEGFLHAYLLIEREIKAVLDTLEGYRLFITGHSLGAAMALIATVRLTGYSPEACYTYGCPRVGDKEYGDSIATPVYRVVNAADVVTRVPWAVPLVADYHHHGELHYITAGEEDRPATARVLRKPGYWTITRDYWRRLRQSWSAGLGDHAPNQYCAKLKAWARR